MALTQDEMNRRAIVIKDRLDETRLIRSLGLKPETAEVWMAIADGYYNGYPVNVTTASKLTQMDKTTLVRHAERLAREEIPMVTINHRGQDTILKVTEEALTDRRVLAYFDFRYKTLVENGVMLSNLLKI